jgi:hypothetical protein
MRELQELKRQQQFAIKQSGKEMQWTAHQHAISQARLAKTMEKRAERLQHASQRLQTEEEALHARLATSIDAARSVPQTSVNRASSTSQSSFGKARSTPQITHNRARSVPEGSYNRARSASQSSHNRAYAAPEASLNRARPTPRTALDRTRSASAASFSRSRSASASSYNRTRSPPQMSLNRDRSVSLTSQRLRHGSPPAEEVSRRYFKVTTKRRGTSLPSRLSSAFSAHTHLISANRHGNIPGSPDQGGPIGSLPFSKLGFHRRSVPVTTGLSSINEHSRARRDSSSGRQSQDGILSNLNALVLKQSSAHRRGASEFPTASVGARSTSTKQIRHPTAKSPTGVTQRYSDWTRDDLSRSLDRQQGARPNVMPPLHSKLFEGTSTGSTLTKSSKKGHPTKLSKVSAKSSTKASVKSSSKASKAPFTTSADSLTPRQKKVAGSVASNGTSKKSLKLSTVGTNGSKPPAEELRSDSVTENGRESIKIKKTKIMKKIKGTKAARDALSFIEEESPTRDNTGKSLGKKRVIKLKSDKKTSVAKIDSTSAVSKDAKDEVESLVKDKKLKTRIKTRAFSDSVSGTGSTTKLVRDLDSLIKNEKKKTLNKLLELSNIKYAEDPTSNEDDSLLSDLDRRNRGSVSFAQDSPRGRTPSTTRSAKQRSSETICTERSPTRSPKDTRDLSIKDSLASSYDSTGKGVESIMVPLVHRDGSKLVYVKDGYTHSAKHGDYLSDSSSASEYHDHDDVHADMDVREATHTHAYIAPCSSSPYKLTMY